jgi:hypothetical protein
VSLIQCRYCDSRHGDLLLCAPAKKVLDALYAQGQRFDMPTVEFPEPVTGPGALGGNTVLVRQMVVKAATMPVAGVSRPVLIFTGRDLAESVLPEWVYPGDATDLRRTSKLVHDMTEMAIRRAREEGSTHGAD